MTGKKLRIVGGDMNIATENKYLIHSREGNTEFHAAAKSYFKGEENGVNYRDYTPHEKLLVEKVEGPFDEKGNLLDHVNKNEGYYYLATLNQDPNIHSGRVKWAISYDGESAQKSYYLFSGGIVENGKVKVKVQTNKAKKTFKIYAYAGILPDDNVSVEVKITVSLIDVTTNAGKYLFSLEPNAKHQAETITAKELYDKGIQWFCPYADNYLKFVKKDPNFHTFKELKHFSWNDIAKFAEVDRWNLKYRAGSSGDWKTSKHGADGFFLITVGHFPYWADAIGQIPFSVDIFKENLKSKGKIEESIKATLKTGKQFGDGKVLGGKSDNSNSYDNHMIVRACLWASKRYKTKEINSWHGGKSISLEKTNHSANNLSHFISKQDYDKYLK